MLNRADLANMLVDAKSPNAIYVRWAADGDKSVQLLRLAKKSIDPDTLSRLMGGDHVRIKIDHCDVDDILRGMASLQIARRPATRKKNGIEMLVSAKDVGRFLTPWFDQTDTIESGGRVFPCILSIKNPVILIRQRKYGHLRPFTGDYALSPWTARTPPLLCELLDPNSEEPDHIPPTRESSQPKSTKRHKSDD